MNTITYWETMLDKHPLHYTNLFYTTLINLSLLGIKMEVKRSNDMLDVAQFQTRSNSKAFPSCVPVPECSCVLEARLGVITTFLLCVCVPVPCNSIHVEIRDNSVGPVIFFLFYMGSRNWTQLSRFAQQAPLPVEPSDQPSALFETVTLFRLEWLAGQWCTSSAAYNF